MEDRDRTAAHIRAARAYADLPQDALARELGISVQTYKRIEGGLRDVKPGEKLLIARLCGVPPTFLDQGPVDTEELRRDLARVEEGYEAIIQRAAEYAQQKVREEIAAHASPAEPFGRLRGTPPDPRGSADPVPQPRRTRRRRPRP